MVKKGDESFSIDPFIDSIIGSVTPENPLLFIVFFTLLARLVAASFTVSTTFEAAFLTFLAALFTVSMAFEAAFLTFLAVLLNAVVTSGSGAIINEPVLDAFLGRFFGRLFEIRFTILLAVLLTDLDSPFELILLGETIDYDNLFISYHNHKIDTRE